MHLPIAAAALCRNAAASDPAAKIFIAMLVRLVGLPGYLPPGYLDTEVAKKKIFFCTGGVVYEGSMEESSTNPYNFGSRPSVVRSPS